MGRRLFTMLLILIMSASVLPLNGCQSTGSSTDASEPTASLTSDVASPARSKEIAAKVELNNTYTTKFGETNAITYPPFSFHYPNGWVITKESVTQQSEMVTLTNDRGAKITFSYIGGEKPGGGSAAVMKQVEVTKVADAGFIPGYVQASDYSNLGNFMVAQLKLVGTLDMKKDKEYTEVDGGMSYAVLPETFGGLHSGLTHPYILDFSFRYAGNVALIADAPNGGFTEQEKQDVIAILASFKDEGALPKTNGGHTAASIDELWTMLKGTWVFKEFTYDGNPRDYAEHNLEFQYIDKKPCMSREYQKDNGNSPDEFFYDLSAIDEFNYDVYTYKRGSYGGEGANWSSDVRLVWWSFDLSNLSNGELSITYHIATDSSIDDSNTFKYRRG